MRYYGETDDSKDLVTLEKTKDIIKNAVKSVTINLPAMEANKSYTIEVTGVTKDTIGILGLPENINNNTYTTMMKARLLVTGQDTNSITITSFGDGIPSDGNTYQVVLNVMSW